MGSVDLEGFAGVSDDAGGQTCTEVDFGSYSANSAHGASGVDLLLGS